MFRDFVEAIGVIFLFIALIALCILMTKKCAAQTTIGLPTKWGNLVVVLPSSIVPINKPHVFFSLRPFEHKEINKNTSYIADECSTGTAVIFVDSHIPRIKGLMLISATVGNKYWIYKRGMPQSLEILRTDELAFWESVEATKKEFWNSFNTKEAV